MSGCGLRPRHMIFGVVARIPFLLTMAGFRYCTFDLNLLLGMNQELFIAPSEAG